MGRERVLILGGGFCGSILSKKLDQKEDIETILIDENGYFEYYPSLPKILTDLDHISNIQLKLDSFLRDTDVIEQEVKEITPDHVKTTEDRFDFDYLVICLGADYPVPLENDEDVFTLNDVENSYKLGRKIQRSESILVVGGGLIGIEAASELAVNTDKEINLVHPHERLIERNPESASRYAERFLIERDVRLIFSDRLVENKDGFHTENGENILADTAIWCGGLGFGRSLYKGFEENVFFKNGSLKVDEYLRLKGYDRIFVGGDITSLQEEKTGHNADRHASLIYRNILKHRNGEELSSYRKSESPLVISLGRKNGILTHRSSSIVGPFPAFLKYTLEKAGIERLRF